jgi:uncharacterized membrane protein
VTQELSFTWHGQVPHPEDIRRYEEIYPGAAEIIFTTFAEQSRHRMYLEKTALEGNLRQADRGLLVGGIILILMLALAGYAIAHGQPAAAVLTSCAALLTGLGAMVWGQQRQRQERLTKMETARARLPGKRA